MKTIKLLLVISALLLTPFGVKGQSNLSTEIGTIMEIQTGADACADTRTIAGILTGNGTWCLLPLTPAAPLPFSPANLSTGLNLALNLIWQRSLGTVTYRIQLSTDSLFNTLVVNDSTVIDSVKAVAGLTPLTYYWWRVSAKGIGGTSLYSVSYKFRTLGYPNALSLINPPNNAVNQPVSIQFRWSRTSEQSSPLMNSDNSKRFSEKKMPSLFNVSGVNNTDDIEAISNYWFDMVTDTVTLANLTRDTVLTDTNKTVSGLNNTISYWWRVKAKNQIGWGSYSVWYKFTTIMAAPAPPVLVSPLNNAVGQNLSLTLVWNKTLSASTYRIQLSTDSLFNTLLINDSTLTDSTRLVSGLSPLTSYWWRVNAKNIGGTSTYSAVYKFRTLGSPALVTLINPPNNAVNQPLTILFRWARASEQTSPFAELIGDMKEPGKQSDEIDAISNYWFDMVTDTSTLANLTRDTILTDTTKSIAGLSNSTNYFWRVKAKNQIGWGSYSVWYKFTTIIAAPPPPVLVSPLNNTVGQNLSLTLVWNKSLTATNYRVQLATDSLFAGLIVNDSTLTDSTRVVSGLNPLTNYWWRVNAKNINGNGVYSTIWKFRTLGSPTQVTLLNPPNNATGQPISINFRWTRASDQTSPLGKGTGKISTKEGTVSLSETDEELVSNYWWELATDTVSLANLQRDTLLTDTAKTASVNYATTYFWRAKAKNQLGWGDFSAWFRFTTSPLPPALVNLTVIPGGFYDAASGKLNMKDTIRVYLVDSVTCLKVDSSKGVIDSVNFTMPLSFLNAATGSYYMIVYHRNHLGVATRFKQSVVRGSSVSYNFTTDSSKAFGFNMIKVSSSPVRWAMIPGDANMDGFIDALDQSIWIAQNGLDGYLAADFNGDVFVDALDQAIWISYNGLGSFLPCGFTLDPGTQNLKQNAPDHDAKKTNRILNEIKRRNTNPDSKNNNHNKKNITK